jgi:hypothetical protein
MEEELDSLWVALKCRYE